MLYNYNIELGSKGISSDIVMDDGSRCLLDVISDPQLLQSFLESGGSVSGNVNGSVNLNSNVNVTLTATTNATITRSTDDGQSTVINGKSQHKIQFSKVNNETNNYVVSGDGKQVDHVTSSVEYTSPVSELSVDEKQHSQQPQTQLTGAVTSISSSTNNNVLMTPMSVSVNQAVQVPSSVPTSISVSLPTSIMSGALSHSSIALTGASISIPTTTPSPVSTPIPIPIRSPVGSMPATIAWPQQLTAQRGPGGAISVIPQQLVQMPGGTLQHVVQTVGGMQQVLLQPRAGVQIPGPTTTVPTGQLVQIIQTPSGTQIVAAPPPPAVQPVTTCSSKSSNSMSSSRSNKQILPKPPGSAAGGNSQSSNNSKQTQQQSTAAPTRTVITNIQTNASVGAPLTATSLQGATAAGAPQILIGPGGQQFIVGQSGPQGTFLLNQMVPGLNHQPFLIQGNIQGPIQLTLRPQAPQVVAVSNASGPTSVSVASSSTSAPLLSALTASTQTIQRTANQPQTYVIPQATSASAPTAQSPAMVMTAGHPGLVTRGQNLILTRPPGLIGATSVPAANQAPQTVPHLLQIQTPNGPMFVALQAAPPNPNGTQTITQNNHAPTPTILPLQQQNTSAHQTLQTILTAPDTFGHQHLQPNGSLCNVATTNTVIYTQQTPANFTSPTNVQQQTVTLSASNNKVSQNRTQAKSVNLAELLKETGILPESSPPSSPTSVNQATELDATAGLTQDLSTAITQQQPTVVMVPSGHNQPNILLTQAPNMTNSNSAPQLRLALAADGSVILQPNITPTSVSQTPILQTNQHLQPIAKVEPHEQQLVTKFTDTCGPGSSQPSPDSTTPTLDVTTPTNSAATIVSTTPVTSTATTITASTQSKSALLQQLNTAPAVKVPESVATLALQQGLTSVVKEESKPPTIIPLTVQNINSTNEQVKEIKTEVQKPRQVATQPVQHVNQSQVPVNVIAPCTSSSAVIQLKSCDTFATTASNANLDGIKVEQNSTSSSCTLVTAAVPTTTTATTLTPTTSVVDQNGVSVVQISLNNQEFIERLETQIKSLSSLKAPTVQQKTLLQELLSLQKTMLEAKNQPQNQNLDGNVILTSQPQILKQQQQQAQQQQQQPQPIQTVNTQQQSQPQNVHLVNLLNKNPVNQPHLRFLTPTNVSSPSNGSTTFQVCNQLITITTPAKTQLQTIQTIATNPASLQTQAILKPQLGSPATQLIHVVRLQPPSQTTQTPNQLKPKITDTRSEQEKQKIKVCQFFQQQLSADQNAAIKPDVKHPFKNRSDACKKLLRYHVFNSRTASEKLLTDIDRDFELISQNLLKRKEELMNRYRLSLLKLCLKESPTQEHIMLNKLFINEETIALKHDKELVLQGKELNLPPLPETWRQKLRESFQEEEARLQINRKRKSSAIEDEFIEECQSQQIKKLDNEDQEVNESEDEDDDSDDEDEDEELDENTNEEMSKYLGPNVGDIGNFLSDVGFSQPSIDLNSSVSCNHYTNNERTHNVHNGDPLYTNNDWRPNSYLPEDRRLDSWNHRYRLTQNEDDVAVNTILDDEDDGENELEVDLTAIQSLEDNEEDEEEGEEDDDEEEEEEQDPNAIQMRCAINSILGNQQQFYNSITPHTTSNNFVPQVMHSMYHSSRNMDFGSSGSQMMLQNDPVLDEAVKSILN